MDLVLVLLILVCATITYDSVTAQRSTAAEIDAARARLPLDEATGLLDRRAYRHRAESELKRAQRSGDGVWIGTWRITAGDPDEFGRRLSSTVQFPEVAFRVEHDLFAVLRPVIDTDASDAALPDRIARAADGFGVDAGARSWSGGPPITPDELVASATARARGDA